MKTHIISIGFDDARFSLKSTKKTTHLIGVICQGVRMVSVVKDKITIDGDDGTRKLIKLVQQNKKHVQFIFTDTITFAGFNLINLEEIYNKTGKPIIAVTEKEVNLSAVKKALLKKFPSTYKQKFHNIIQSGLLYETEIKTAGGFSKVYYHSKGIDVAEVNKLLEKVCIDSKLPECVRLAHLIGRIF